MSTFKAVEDKLNELERQRESFRQKLTNESEKLENAIGMLVGAIRSCEGNIGNGLEESSDFVSAIKNNAENEIKELERRLGIMENKARERAEALQNLDVNAIASEAEQSARQFTDDAANVINDKVSELINEVREDVVIRLSEELKAVDMSFSEAQLTFVDKTDEWEVLLVKSRTVLEARLTELTNIEVNEMWQATGEQMREQFTGEIVAVFERLKELRQKITDTLDSIRRITAMFGEARKLKNAGMQGAGTGLEAVASILADLEDIFKSIA